MSDNQRTPVIDGYAHAGLPRFLSVQDALTVLDGAGIERALISSFPDCPDLAGIHRVLAAEPHRLRAIGVPLGGDRSMVERGIAAQMAAGFCGQRLTESDVTRAPWILDAVGAAHGLVLMCGGADGLAASAGALLRYLDRYADALVLGGHCAAPTTVDVFERSAEVAELFGHERFAVVVSRQTMFDPALVESWLGELVRRVGWRRMLWGSEIPVLFWRDESIAEARAWIERFGPTATERAEFFGGTAQRLIFDRPTAGCSALDLPFDPWRYAEPTPAPMWPRGLGIDADLPARLVQAWLRWGGSDRGPLSHYLSTVLRDGLSVSSE